MGKLNLHICMYAKFLASELCDEHEKNHGIQPALFHIVSFIAKYFFGFSSKSHLWPPGPHVGGGRGRLTDDALQLIFFIYLYYAWVYVRTTCILYISNFFLAKLDNLFSSTHTLLCFHSFCIWRNQVREKILVQQNTWKNMGLEIFYSNIPQMIIIFNFLYFTSVNLNKLDEFNTGDFIKKVLLATWALTDR